jgi:hypothetical protein
MSGLDVHYDLGEGHPLLGRRMPDLDLVTADGPRRVFSLLNEARPVLLNLGEPGAFDIAPWVDRVRLIHARYAGVWELPVLGAVSAPTAVLNRQSSGSVGLCTGDACETESVLREETGTDGESLGNKRPHALPWTCHLSGCGRLSGKPQWFHRAGEERKVPPGCWLIDS